MEEKINFECAVESVENIISTLEKGNEPLDKTIKLYNEAVRLINKCKKSLDDAKNQVEVIYTDSEDVSESDSGQDFDS